VGKELAAREVSKAGRTEDWIALSLTPEFVEDEEVPTVAGVTGGALAICNEASNCSVGAVPEVVVPVAESVDVVAAGTTEELLEAVAGTELVTTSLVTAGALAGVFSTSV